MKTNSESRRQDEHWEFGNYGSRRWVTYITQAVAVGITRIVATAITVVVAILVIIGGLWLAYEYLPVNVFYIILAVLIADIALGIVLRSVFARRQG
jgi:hypothetical protein